MPPSDIDLDKLHADFYREWKLVQGELDDDDQAFFMAGKCGVTIAMASSRPVEVIELIKNNESRATMSLFARATMEYTIDTSISRLEEIKLKLQKGGANASK